MKPRTWLSGLALMAALVASGGCSNKQGTGSESVTGSAQEESQGDLTPRTRYEAQENRFWPFSRRVTLPSGTPVRVTLATNITSETASAGDSWSGTVREPVVVNGRTVIPEGSMVSGTVSAARPAQRGSRAMLDLAMTSVEINGRSYRVRGGTPAIVAGSPRARNLGAIAGGAAAGALVGRAVSGSGKGTLIGGVVGGAAATGVVAKSKGYQVHLEPGTSLTFTTSETVALRT